MCDCRTVERFKTVAAMVKLSFDRKKNKRTADLAFCCHWFVGLHFLMHRISTHTLLFWVFFCVPMKYVK